MRHLVTGGSGFLGNLITRRLRERGHFVRTIDILEDHSIPDGVEFVKGNIQDLEAVRVAMQGIDIVHHTAALVPVTKSGKTFRKVNAEGSRIVAEAAARSGAKGFIHMSSSAVFGIPGSCPITDQTPTRPAEIYGRAKLDGEHAVIETCQRAGLPLIVIRPRTILGQGRLGIFYLIFKWIHEGNDVYVIGDGSNKMQFIHADDLMDAYMLALDLNQPGIYNVGTDRFGSLRQVFENLIKHAGSGSRVRSLPVIPTISALRVLDVLKLSPLAPWHYLTYHKDFFYDVSALLKLGWNPKYSNDDMFQESYDWFLQNRRHLSAAESSSPHRRVIAEELLGVIRRII